MAEEMLERVVCSREQFSFQMCCVESGDGSGTFHCNWRQGVPDSWCRDVLDWKLMFVTG